MLVSAQETNTTVMTGDHLLRLAIHLKRIIEISSHEDSSVS